jgi:hypothetical protein
MNELSSGSKQFHHARVKDLAEEAVDRLHEAGGDIDGFAPARRLMRKRKSHPRRRSPENYQILDLRRMT